MIEWQELPFAWMPVIPVPTRSDTIKAGWAMIRDQWPIHQVDGRLELLHDLGIVEPMMFEQIRYGDEWVIECEGLIVERIAV